jgi:transposase-like protein
MTRSPFRYFKTSPEIIQLAVMMYIRFALSLRNVEDLLHERGIDVCMRASACGSIGLGVCLPACWTSS